MAKASTQTHAEHIAPEHVGSYAPAPRAQSVSPRWDAAIDRGTVHLIDDAATKLNTLPSHPGEPSGMLNLQTRLRVTAWVKNTTYAKNVWVDVHLFGPEGELVHSETLPLAYVHPADDTADAFVLDQVLYQGSIASEGSVAPRPDVRAVEYRLYSELDGHVYTDGDLHECVLKDDTEFNG